MGGGSGGPVANTINTVTNTIGRANAQAGGAGSAVDPFDTEMIGGMYRQNQAVDDAKRQEGLAQQQAEGSARTVDQLRQKQQNFANSLAQNAQRDQGLLMDRAAGSERRQLSQRLLQNKESANRRGLLGSGMQKYQNATDTANANADLADKQSQIQEMSRQQITDAQNLADRLGLQAAGVQQNAVDQYYNIAMQNLQDRNAAYRDLFRAGGTVAGSYLSRQNGYGEKTSPTYGG